MPTIAERLNTWWRTYRRRRAWQKLPPERQLAIWIDTIDKVPALREQFQAALRVKGYDRLPGERASRPTVVRR